MPTACFGDKALTAFRPLGGFDLPFVDGRTFLEMAAVGLVAPYEFKPLCRQVYLPKQFDPSHPVVDVGCRDEDGDWQPQHVHGQVPLAPVDQFAAVNPAVQADEGPLPDTLAVNCTGRGFGVPVLPNPLIFNELREHDGPGTVPFPLAEIVVDGLPRERAFKVAPLAARPVQLEDGVKDGAEAVANFSASDNEILDNLPLGIGQAGEALTPEMEFDFDHSVVIDDFATTNYSANSHSSPDCQFFKNPLLDFKTYSYKRAATGLPQNNCLQKNKFFYLWRVESFENINLRTSSSTRNERRRN